MKKIFLLLLLAGCTQSKTVEEPKLPATDDFLVTTEGIGEIKINMRLADLEKLLNTKLNLKNPTDSISGSWWDSATVRYKNADVFINFQRRYSDEKNFEMEIISLKTASQLAKTKNGVTIGSDKLKLISAYEDYPVLIYPGLDSNNKRLPTSTIVIKDRTVERVISFYLKDNKTTAIETGVLFEDVE